MRNIRNSLNNLFPRINSFQENPEVTILRISEQGGSTNPFSVKANSTYDDQYTMPCLFSSQPEVVTANNNITTQEVSYIYVREEDLPVINDISSAQNGQQIMVSMADRLIFKGKRYRPVGIIHVFNYIQIRAVRE